MQRQELLRTVIKEEEKLRKSMSFQNGELQYLEDFLENNKIQVLTDLKDLDVTSFMIAYCNSKNPAFTISELKDVFLSLEPFCQEKSALLFFAFFDKLNQIYINNDFSTIKAVFEEKNAFAKKSGLKTLLKNAHIKKTIEIVQLLENPEFHFLSYFIMLDKDYDTVDKAVSMASAAKEAGALVNLTDLLTSKQANLANSDTKRQYDLLNKLYGIKPILRNFEVIKERIKYLKSLENKRKRDAERGISEYEKLRNKLLEQDSTGLILHHHELTSRIPNEKIKLEVLKYIYMSNLKYYKELEEKYRYLSENSITKYQSLLNKYNISIDMYDINSVMRNSIEDVEEMLKMVLSFGIQDKTQIVNILQVSSKAYLDKIAFVFKSGYFGKEFLVSHPVVLENQSFYDTFTQNKESLEEKRLNPFLLAKDEVVWLSNPEILKENLDVLQHYQLLDNMSKATKYQFLESEQLETTIDTILELGYESLLEKNIDLLNYDINQWMRIYILKELNMVPEDMDTLIKVLSQEQFFVPDEKMHEYISNVSCNIEEVDSVEVATEKEVRKTIDTFSQTKRTYAIQGIFLSKYKVDKNMNEVSKLNLSLKDKVYLSLTNHTILSEDQHTMIRQAMEEPIKKLG